MACWGVKANDGAGPAVVSEDDDGDEPGTTIVDDRLDEGPGAGDVAATEHGSCMGWWEGVLGRWHEKTQLVDPGLQKKFRVVNQGPWAQVKASLADRDRANRRAFMTEAEVCCPCVYVTSGTRNLDDSSSWLSRRSLLSDAVDNP